jgi:hypothetical protein
MRFEFGALPWELLGRRPVMVTLTYPGEWELWVPDARTLHRHREALKMRWTRRYGAPVGVWVTEFQKRGAPHLHMYLGLPDEVSEAEYRTLQKRTIKRKQLERQVGPYEARRRLRAPGGEFGLWLRTAWAEIVDSQLAVHHGRGVDIATAFFSDQAEAETNRTRVAEYFWRESGKWAQKIPPEDFGPLKFYGRWGRNDGFNPVVTEAHLGERSALELRRVLRRMQQGKLREAALRAGRRVRRGAGGSRGRDGLTVFGVDGRAIGPRLMEWADLLAAEKSAGHDVDEQVFISGAGGAWLRAWSEFEIDTNPEPEGDADGEPDWVDIDPLDALIEEHEEREAAIEAAIDAQSDAAWKRGLREWRKAEVRESEQRRRG